MLTVSEREHDLVSALLAGARGYVLKGSRESEIVDAVRAVARGDFYFTSNLVVRVLIERGKRIENGRQRRSSVTSPFARSNSFRLCRGQYPN